MLDHPYYDCFDLELGKLADCWKERSLLLKVSLLINPLPYSLAGHGALQEMKRKKLQSKTQKCAILNRLNASTRNCLFLSERVTI
jgi:hypothetical protein